MRYDLGHVIMSTCDLQVEQIGEAKVLFKTREFTTLLNVDEDARNPEELRTGFTLIRSVRACFGLP